MRRPNFFISSRSQSADLLASELVLAICDQYPKIEISGLVGKWTGRTRVSPIATLDEILSIATVSGLDGALAHLRPALLEHLPQLAILVGYSAFHHRLAGFYQENQIPVVLYEITPQHDLHGVSLEEARQRLPIALSIHRAGSPFIRAANIPYRYIGSPYRDRVAKVSLQARAFDFLNRKALVTLLPGGYGGALIKKLPLFIELSQGILDSNDCQIVMSLREERDFSAASQKLKDVLGSAKIEFVLGMHLELLSLSKVAVTGCGAISIEAAISGIPFLPVHDQVEQADESGFHSLINQSLGYQLVEEYSLATPVHDLVATVSSLLRGGTERQSFIKKLEDVRSEFLGSASDNAAEYLTHEIGLGRKRSKTIVPPP